jgi:hypothetical protein
MAEYMRISAADIGTNTVKILHAVRHRMEQWNHASMSPTRSESAPG